MKLSEKINERVILNKRNKISIAITLKNLKDKANEFGAYLYHRGIMGSRVVIRNENIKKIEDYEFENFGGHIDKEYEGFPYMTIAIAIGC